MPKDLERTGILFQSLCGGGGEREREGGREGERERERERDIACVFLLPIAFY